jgi:hypothetical protein
VHRSVFFYFGGGKSLLNFLFIYLFSDESSSGEEDLDEEGIQRRRDLMRQRALARAQIGVGQEEIMVRLK